MRSKEDRMVKVLNKKNPVKFNNEGCKKHLQKVDGAFIIHGEMKTMIHSVIDSNTGLPCIKIILFKFGKDKLWNKVNSTYLDKKECLALVHAIKHFELLDKNVLNKEEKYLVHEFKLLDGRALEVKSIKSNDLDRGDSCMEITFTNTSKKHLGQNDTDDGQQHLIRRKRHRKVLFNDEASLLLSVISQTFSFET